jgi:hypothetical protein
MMVFVQPATFNRDVDELVATGATWIRMDIPIGYYGSVSGTSFQPNPERVAFYRQAAQYAKSKGLKIALVMAAAYAAPTETDFRNVNGQYWRAVSQNIGDLVDLWQVFNEHDGRDYRNHAPISLSSAYLTRFRDTLASCRYDLRTFSDAPLTTTPFGYPVNQARYDKWIQFFDGIGSSLDVIGVHAYPEKSATTIGLVPKYITSLEQRYAKPVALLEFGLPNVAGYGTPIQVGQAVTDQIAAVMTADPFCATLYQLRDRGPSFVNGAPNTDGEKVFGVLYDNYARKPYYGQVVEEVRRHS